MHQPVPNAQPSRDRSGAAGPSTAPSGEPERTPTVQVCEDVALRGTMWQRGLWALLERGDTAGVRRACNAAVQRAEAGARLAAARAALRIGDWRLALRLGRSLARTTIADRGWTVAGVAAWAAGRSSLADRILRRVWTLDRDEFAGLWTAAEGAMLLDRQRSPRVAGADPTSGLLEPLTSHALGVLDEAVARHETYADLHYHRGALLSHLGLAQEAAEEFDRALQINAAYARARQAREALRDRAPA